MSDNRKIVNFDDYKRRHPDNSGNVSDSPASSSAANVFRLVSEITGNENPSETQQSEAFDPETFVQIAHDDPSAAARYIDKAVGRSIENVRQNPAAQGPYPLNEQNLRMNYGKDFKQKVINYLEDHDPIHGDNERTDKVLSALDVAGISEDEPNL